MVSDLPLGTGMLGGIRKSFPVGVCVSESLPWEMAQQSQVRWNQLERAEARAGKPHCCPLKLKMTRNRVYTEESS